MASLSATHAGIVVLCGGRVPVMSLRVRHSNTHLDLYTYILKVLKLSFGIFELGYCYIFHTMIYNVRFS